MFSAITLACAVRISHAETLQDARQSALQHKLARAAGAL
jgi:hypothetical protein